MLPVERSTGRTTGRCPVLGVAFPEALASHAMTLEDPAAQAAHLARAGVDIACAHVDQGQYEQAARCFEAAVTLGARLDAAELAVFALSLARSAQQQRARAVCDLAIGLVSQNPDDFAIGSKVRQLIFEIARMIEAPAEAANKPSFNLYALRAQK